MAKRSRLLEAVHDTTSFLSGVDILLLPAQCRTKFFYIYLELGRHNKHDSIGTFNSPPFRRWPIYDNLHEPLRLSNNSCCSLRMYATSIIFH